MRGRSHFRLLGGVVALVFVIAVSIIPVAFASCSSSVNENEPPATATPTSSPTATMEPTSTPTIVIEPTPTGTPNHSIRTISTLVDEVEAGKISLVVGGSSEYFAGAKLTLNYGKGTQEDISLIEVRFERRPNRGVNVLLLKSPLVYSHSVGEGVTGKVIETVLVPPEPQNVRFSFDPSTTEADQKLIKNGVAYAHSFFFEKLGYNLTDQIEVKTLAQQSCLGGGRYVSYPGGICLIIGDGDWSSYRDVDKMKIVAHEYYHILQISMGCLVWGDSFTYYATPTWLTEGAAELVGSLVISQSGGTSIEDRRLFWVQNNLNNPTRQLATFETRSQETRYDLAALATDKLVMGDPTKLLGYCKLRAQGLDWKPSFEQAFGISPSDFYTQFELYRANGYR